MSKKLIWRTIGNNNKIAFDEEGNLVIAPKWYKEYYRKMRRKIERRKRLLKRRFRGGRKK